MAFCKVGNLLPTPCDKIRVGKKFAKDLALVV